MLIYGRCRGSVRFPRADVFLIFKVPRSAEAAEPAGVEAVEAGTGGPLTTEVAEATVVVRGTRLRPCAGGTTCRRHTRG